MFAPCYCWFCCCCFANVYVVATAVGIFKEILRNDLSLEDNSLFKKHRFMMMIIMMMMMMMMIMMMMMMMMMMIVIITDDTHQLALS